MFQPAIHNEVSHSKPPVNFFSWKTLVTFLMNVGRSSSYQRYVHPFSPCRMGSCKLNDSTAKRGKYTVWQQDMGDKWRRRKTTSAHCGKTLSFDLDMTRATATRWNQSCSCDCSPPAEAPCTGVSSIDWRHPEASSWRLWRPDRILPGTKASNHPNWYEYNICVYVLSPPSDPPSTQQHFQAQVIELVAVCQALNVEHWWKVKMEAKWNQKTRESMRWVTLWTVTCAIEDCIARIAAIVFAGV